MKRESNLNAISPIQLSAVRLWLKLNRPTLGQDFTLLQPFPRKLMTDEDMATPLSVHGEREKETKDEGVVSQSVLETAECR